MSEHASHHQSSLHSDTALQTIRSQKLRDFLSKKPSFLRSTTPDASYSSTHDFHKNTPPYLGFLEDPDGLHGPKVTSFTPKGGSGAIHKPTRSRSSSELEQMLQKFNQKDLLTEVNSLHGSANSKTLIARKGRVDDSKGKQYGISSVADTNNSLYQAKSLTKLEKDEKRDSLFNRGRPKQKTSDAFGSTARTTERDYDSDAKNMIQQSKDQRNIPFKTDQFGNPVMIDSIKNTGNRNQKGWQQPREDVMRSEDPYEEEINADNSLDNIIDMMGPKTLDKDRNRVDVRPEKDSGPSSSINLDDVVSPDNKDLPLGAWAKPASSFVAQQATSNPALSIKQASSQKEIDLLGPPSQNNIAQYQLNDPRKSGTPIEDLLNQDFIVNTNSTNYEANQQIGIMLPQGTYTQYDPNQNNLYANFGNNVYQQKQTVQEGHPNYTQHSSPIKPQEGMPNQASTQMYSHSPSYPQMQPQSQSSGKGVPQINLEGLPMPKALQNRQPTFDPTQLDYSSPAHANGQGILNSERQLIQPIVTGRESFEAGMRLTDPLLAQYGNPKLGISFTSRGDALAQSSICRFHPSNVVSYVCIKENCGELLCPLCLYEHQKNKHIGEYEAIPSFTVLIKQKLEQAQETLNGTLEQIKKYQTVMSDKSKFDLRIVEELSQIEANLVKNVRQFFDSIRQEFSKDIFFDFPKVSEDLTVLHQDLSTTVKSLTDDLATISQDTPLLNPHILTHIVQKDYLKSAVSSNKTVNTLEGRIRRFLDEGFEFNAEPKLNLEVNSRLISKLLVLLTEGVRIQDKPSKQTLKEISQVTSLDILPQTMPQVRSENTITEPTFHQKPVVGHSREDEKVVKVKPSTQDFIREERKQDLTPQREVINKISERNRHEEEDSQQRPRTVSPWKGASNTVNVVRAMNNNTGNITPNSLQQTQKGVKTHLDTKKLNEDITNRVLEMYNAGVTSAASRYLGDKDVDIPMMKFLFGYMERYYNTNKIKVIDPAFFQKLLNTGDSLDFTDFGRKELFFENVVEELQAGLPKSKSVFTSCEKVFMLGKITTSQWFLVEIRSNPKAIILYDFLGKFQKSKFSENLFGLVLEIIRKEYNSKLGQNPESYLWDKKVAPYPTLIVKNSADTGVLALKVISHCYQNKELTSGKVTLNEISLTRKKIDKILKMYEEKKNHNQFVHI